MFCARKPLAGLLQLAAACLLGSAPLCAVRLAESAYAVDHVDLSHHSDGTFSMIWKEGAFQLVEPPLWWQRFDESGVPVTPRVFLSEAFVGRAKIATDGAGRDLVVWSEAGETAQLHSLKAIVLADDGSAIWGPSEVHSISSSDLFLRELDVAPHPSGGWWICWEQDSLATPDESLIQARRILSGGPSGEVVSLSGDSPLSRYGPVLSAGAAGSTLAAWATRDPAGRSAIVVRRLGAASAVDGSEREVVSEVGDSWVGYPSLAGYGADQFFLDWIRIAPNQWSREIRAMKLLGDHQSAPSVTLWQGPGAAQPNAPAAADAAGRVAITWTESLGEPSGRERIQTQSFDVDLASLTEPLIAATVASGYRSSATTVSTSSSGEWVVAWPMRSLTDPAWGVDATLGRFGVRCIATLESLCLTGSRFEVEASFHDHLGHDGVGQGVPLGAESGTFWFYTPANTELIVKVIDACSHPDFHDFWVYAAGLTDVAVTLTVVDTWTGEIWERETVLGEPFPPVLDSQAFHTCDAVPIVGPMSQVDFGR